MAELTVDPVAPIPPGQVRRPGRSRPLAARFLLAIGSTAIFLLAIVGAEGLARVCAPDYLTRTRGLHVFSAAYGWAPRRGASAQIDGNQVSFNARGYRGRELALPKTGGLTRVVVLGDSVAFGPDVSDEQTFTYLLDSRDNGIEAGNLAVQGYGPGQELLVLLRDGLRENPDVVVLAFCLSNDFADAVLPVSLYDGTTPKPRFRLAGDRLVLDDSRLQQSSAVGALQWLGDYSHVFNRVSALAPGREPPPGIHWKDRKREALQDEDYALRLSVALVRRMNTLCQERGITFLVAAFPSQASYRVKPSLAERFVESLESEDIPVVDMAAHFRALGLRFDEVALDWMGHLSPRGHSIASQVLERDIASRVSSR